MFDKQRTFECLQKFISRFFQYRNGITCLADTKRIILKGEEDKSLLHKVRYTKNTIFISLGYANFNEYIMYVLSNPNFSLLENLQRLEFQLKK